MGDGISFQTKRALLELDRDMGGRQEPQQPQEPTNNRVGGLSAAEAQARAFGISVDELRKRQAAKFQELMNKRKGYADSGRVNGALEDYVRSQRVKDRTNPMLGSVVSRAPQEQWQPEYEKEPGLEAPMISPEDLLLMGGPSTAKAIAGGLRNARLLGGKSGAIPLEEFLRNKALFQAPQGQRTLYHTSPVPWEGDTPRAGTWFSTEPPTKNTPFGNTVRVYTVPEEQLVGTPIARGRGSISALESYSGAIAPIDEGGMTSYVVKDPSVLQRLAVKRPIISRLASGTPASQVGSISPDIFRLSKENLGDTVTPELNFMNRHAGPGLYGSLDAALNRKMYIGSEPNWVGGKFPTDNRGKSVVAKLVRGEPLTDEEIRIAQTQLNLGGLTQYKLSTENLLKPSVDISTREGSNLFKEITGLRPPKDTVSSEIMRMKMLSDELGPEFFRDLPFGSVIHPAPGAFKTGKDMVVYENSPLRVIGRNELVPR